MVSNTNIYLDVLNAAVGGDDCVLDVIVPQVALCQVPEQMLIDHLELTG